MGKSLPKLSLDLTDSALGTSMDPLIVVSVCSNFDFFTTFKDTPSNPHSNMMKPNLSSVLNSSICGTYKLQKNGSLMTHGRRIQDWLRKNELYKRNNEIKNK